MIFLVILVLFNFTQERLITVKLNKKIKSGFGLSFISETSDNKLEEKLRLSLQSNATNIVTLHNYQNVQ